MIGIVGRSRKTILVLGLALAAFVPASAQARTFRVLHSFTGSDGAVPEGALIEDANGNLYGTTSGGGADVNGVVFMLTPRRQETVLYTFTGGNDGGRPRGGLVRDASGRLYGTASVGGASSAGVVFKLTSRGREIVLHSFAGQPDGFAPVRGLIVDAAGNFYGTTEAGGAADDGTVFRITPRGRETVLYSFTGGASGVEPIAGVIRDDKGNLYGTAGGGANGVGVVFKLNPRRRETVLHSFAGQPDGAVPFGGLVRTASGNLYGTTGIGGSIGAGTVFKLTPRGRETVLHSFRGRDGANPEAALIRDDAGNLYGTTVGGGRHNQGTVFMLTPAGEEVVLHSFTGGNDGAVPGGALLRDNDGNLYGTASAGGASGNGVVFKISP